MLTKITWLSHESAAASVPIASSALYRNAPRHKSLG
jgi:hypothetical protein